MNLAHPLRDFWIMNNGKIKVLSIAGWGRSGSTILDNILGQIDGFFSVGELRYIWDRNLIDNRLCGCGAPFKECEVWQRVLDEAFGGIDQIDPYEMIDLRDGATRSRHLPLMLIPWRQSSLISHLGEYLANLEKLYRAIQSTSGSRVIVDSSKFPSYGYMLRLLPAIDLYVVHLIRDPRGVAYSWLRRRKLELNTEAPIYMKSFGPGESSLIWNTWNMAIEAIWRSSRHRYLRLHYEDFVQRPQEAVERILDLLHEEAPRLPFVDTHKVELGINHTTSGNPNRVQTGVIALRSDEAWKEKMKQSNKALVTMLTWPLLVRYGYFGRLKQ
jgi:hypothetical protein